MENRTESSARPLLPTLCLALVLVSLSGCAYGKARWNDFFDVWRAHAGISLGFGAYAQVTDEVPVGLDWGAGLQAGLAPGEPWPGFVESDNRLGWLFGGERGHVIIMGPRYEAELYDEDDRAWKYDEIKLSLRFLYVGGQIGFDPLELADFLVGVAGVDLVGDDHDGFPSPQFAQFVQALHTEHRLLDPNDYDSRNLPLSDRLQRLDQVHTRATALAQAPSLISQTDPHGRTALHWAAAYRHTEAVQALLANGADPHRQDRRQSTALDYAIRYCTDPRGAKPVAEPIRAAGAKLSCDPITLIFQGILREDPGLIEFAVEQGADLKADRLYDPVTLQLSQAMARRFVEDGGYPQLTLYSDPERGTTPLHFALHGNYGNEKILKALLENGVNPNQPNAEGQTPLQAATADGREESAKRLRLHGASDPQPTPPK